MVRDEGVSEGVTGDGEVGFDVVVLNMFEAVKGKGGFGFEFIGENEPFAEVGGDINLSELAFFGGDGGDSDGVVVKVDMLREDLCSFG